MRLEEEGEMASGSGKEMEMSESRRNSGSLLQPMKACTAQDLLASQPSVTKSSLNLHHLSSTVIYGVSCEAIAPEA